MSQSLKTYPGQSAPVRAKTPEQALSSLMRQCARAERCSGDAMRLMRRWGLSEEDARKVLGRLMAERFIDDSRYAEAFVREKVRFSGWGVHKIRAALRAKQIAPTIVDAALTQLAPDDNHGRLVEMLRKKAARTPHKDAYDLKTKLVRFGMSRGFDLDDVLAAIEECLVGSDV